MKDPQHSRFSLFIRFAASLLRHQLPPSLSPCRTLRVTEEQAISLPSPLLRGISSNNMKLAASLASVIAMVVVVAALAHATTPIVSYHGHQVVSFQVETEQQARAAVRLLLPSPTHLE